MLPQALHTDSTTEIFPCSGASDAFSHSSAVSAAHKGRCGPRGDPEAMRCSFLSYPHQCKQVSAEKPASTHPVYGYGAGPSSFGNSWAITFPTSAGDASSLLVSTENGPQSRTTASAGTLTGTDARVIVIETVKGGLLTQAVSGRTE